MQPAFGLYTHIRANAFRSVLLIAGLFGLIYCLAFGYTMILTAVFDSGSFGYILHHSVRSVWLISPHITAVAVAWVVIGYTFNKWIIGKMTGAAAVTRKDEPELYNLLENLCVSRGMTMPTLSIIETPELNAFASGLTEKSYAVTVTRGLIECLDDDEIEAVLAHELTHIRNHDVRLMVIAVVIVGMISIAIEMMFRFFFFSSGNRGSSRGPNGALPAILAGIAIIIGVWFLSQMMNFALSRRREYMADAGAVELTKNPDAMISALRKIEDCSDIEGLPSGMMEMCIDNPRSDFTSWFATHPTIDDRIDALKRFAGGQDRVATKIAPRRRIAERSIGPVAEPEPASNPWSAGNTAQASGHPTGVMTAPNPWSVEDIVVVGSVLEQAAKDAQPPTRPRRSPVPGKPTTAPAAPTGQPTPKPALPTSPVAVDAQSPWSTNGSRPAPSAGFAPQRKAQQPVQAKQASEQETDRRGKADRPEAHEAAKPTPTPAVTASRQPPTPPARTAKLKRPLNRAEPQGFGKRSAPGGFGKRTGTIKRKA